MARKNKNELTLSELASIDARGARLYCGRAHIRRQGDEYVMEGPSGIHAIKCALSSLERVNAHWVTFASKNEYA